MDTSRDYAPKHAWIDPVAEVEREAYQKGFIRGVVSTFAALVGTFVVIDVALGLGRAFEEQVLPIIKAAF